MKKRRRWKIAAILVLALLVSGCGKAETAKVADQTESITIGYLPITHSLAVLEEKELLEQESAEIQIELRKFSSWTDLMDALNSGQIDGASALIELAMGAASQGIDLKAAALGHKDGNVIVVSEQIEKTEDLKGKTFAIPSNQSSHNILLQDMLAEAGLSIDDLKVVQLAPTEMPSSLASGAIDGYCVAEPFGAQAVVKNIGHVLYDSNELWEDSVCCALVLNQKFIDESPAEAEKLVEKYYEAGAELNQETALELAEKYLGQETETLETSLEWIHYDDLKLSKEDYDLLAQKVKDYGINDNPPSYEDFIYQGAE